VRIDLVLSFVPARVAWLMEAATDVLGFLVCLAMMRYGVKMTIDSALLGSITIKNLVFPEWWLLWRVSRDQQLRDPARLFLEAERLNPAHLGPALRVKEAQLESLAGRLFDGMAG